VEAVLAGETFRSAGKIVGLSGARTAQNFYKTCEELGISQHIETLRADPEPVRRALRERMRTPTISLPEPVLRKLLAPSGYNIDKLTPENISKELASEVLRRFGPTGTMRLKMDGRHKGLCIAVPCGLSNYAPSRLTPSALIAARNSPSGNGRRPTMAINMKVN